MRKREGWNRSTYQATDFDSAIGLHCAYEQWSLVSGLA
jgi:hypothetical protein